MEVLIFYIALFVLICYETRKYNFTIRVMLFLIILCSPPFVLLDHGYLDFNCIPIGLVVCMIFFCRLNRPIVASIFFIISLNYKQISLYCGIPFFIYLLKKLYEEACSFTKVVHQRLIYFFLSSVQLIFVVILTHLFI